MEYYIQGSRERGEEIKTIFEAKGYTLYRLVSNCNSEDLIYYSLNGIVRGIKKDNLYLFEAHPGYEELKLPTKPQFKEGDWVVKKDGKPFCSGNYAEQITSIEDDEKGKCIYLSSTSCIRDNVIRLWTIKDAKVGDVLIDRTTNIIGIFKEINKTHWYSKIYCGNANWGSVFSNGGLHKIEGTKPATKEQRNLLFDKIKELDYEWDKKKKELHKIIEPMFKVGDEIFRVARNEYFKIKSIEKDNGIMWYVTTRTRIADNDKRAGEIVRINVFYQNEYSIMSKPHYDISNFKPFDKVLVRDADDTKWRCNWFSHYSGDGGVYRFVTTKCGYAQCIPFNEDTKHLLGTTDPCDECYINW